MTFTNEELSAILKLANAMVNADGRIAKEELSMIFHELARFGVDQNKSNLLAEIGENMTNADACQIVSRMTPYEKKYVTAYLGTLICIDGDINDTEQKLWSLISLLCGLPEMSIADAIKFMAEF